MVKSRGQKRAQPENDPHHTTLHFVHNKNLQKKEARIMEHKTISKVDNAPKDKIAGRLTFSASRAPKRLGSSSSIPIPLTGRRVDISGSQMDEKKEKEIGPITDKELFALLK
jgi:hypothetical protein